MVVMSACNSGSGTLYQGEGLMSLARGFILAGAASVIKTAWDVNDEVSATIISAFYYNLSKGMQKDEALRKAKLDYLKASPPSQANPYYWAAYEVMGDDSPVTGNNRNIIIAAGSCAIFLIGFLIFYFRRRRIFSARSL
jgi:LPXTG-motif cell wall-anchored protein